MASFASRTGQKIKEWWGAKVTIDPQMETKKQKINEIDQYIKGLTQSFSNLSALFQQMHGHLNRISAITQKLYEKETDTNKRIGIEVTSMFGNLSELFRSKTEPTSELNKNFGEWFQTIETLKVQMTTFSDIRLIYDHYKLKVDELEKDRSTNVQKGQVEDFKLSEKIRRNQSKLSSSETNYKQRLSEILNNMNKLLGGYYRMINTSLDSFITINYDLFMNAKSIVKKNQKAFNKFKYPELEPIIDLMREQKEMTSLIEREQQQRDKELKEKELKEKEKEKKEQSDNKEVQQSVQQVQQPAQQPPPQQTPQWDTNSKFNPFGQTIHNQQMLGSQMINQVNPQLMNQSQVMNPQLMNQPQVMNPQLMNPQVMNPQMMNPQMMNQQMMNPMFQQSNQFMNPMMSQRQSQQPQFFNQFDDSQFQMMSDIRQQQWPQSSVINQSQYVNSNPFQQNRQSQNPFMDMDPDTQRKALFDNPYTYNSQFQDNNKTNPFM